jgi:hypothetical protein
MKVPVFIRYSKIEELCDHDEQEGIICDDFKGYVDVDVGDIQLNRNDLKKLLNEYLDDIAEILKADRSLLDELLRKLNINLNTW